ncbi:MAG TPA: polysaccharide deacetylase family protein [Xanthobacteraceae bacterium]|jgi:peptidoglycan/xylan/chitin deacetylase (PgdA/CDA1 family)
MVVVSAGAGPVRAEDSARANAQGSAQVNPQGTQDSVQQCPGNSDALGTSRVIAIDADQLEHVGRMQYPDSLPLADKEVVLTFDDGPLPPYSNQILDILASQCVKATYFMVGSMARAYPQVVRRVYEAGHTIGTHSENHPTHFGTLPIERMRHEIDDGIADVGAALGDPKYLAPFFRIPGLARSDTADSELAARSLIVFSSDTVADDWHRRITPSQITALALKRLEARGKGILLLHDIHPTTVAALPGLLKGLKDNGFRIVQVVPSPAYLIAMAAKPRTRMLASAVPEALNIDDGSALPPAWPPALPQRADNFTPDDVALPVPDVSAFEPDSGVSEDHAEVHWPAQPEAVPPAPDEKASGKAPRSSRHAHAASHERRRAERPHGRRHQRADTSDPSNGVLSRVKTFASLLTPNQPAH